MTRPITLEEIDERLRSLDESLLVGPEDSRALGRIIELHIPAAPTQQRAPVRANRRWVVRLGAIAATIAIAILLNVVAAYYAPTYGRALADAPGVGGPSSTVLATFGLNTRQLTAVNDSATASGHTLRLAAGYADGLRTVLFVSIDGKGLDGNPKGYGMSPGDYGLGDFSLSDQFGHAYVPSGVGSPNWIPFTPLAWPASRVGARLTLHVTSIDALWLRGTGEIHGDWILHATLVAEPARTLALPAPVRVPQATYTFTSIRSSATTLVIRWTIDGPALDRVNELWAAGGNRTDPNVPPPPPTAEERQLERDYFSPQVFDASGRQMQLSMSGITFTRPATGEITVFIPGPGRYRIRLGDALAADDLQRWIVVP
ncbi:MAG: hypothetical protein E6I73_04800 [Chloroflexi bacterium]|nr:MAG: hypothetical protein E6I73_04800 [Chloroflexota bacterium]